ncbi:NUDIX hydrolase [Paenibacillus roseipurpureus]|uniref:NUDIX hydrolase n=1 Tax=Paenibacillus roseopurpureus TaxID=2918901 RepID=A0AA96RLG3_9BACL|nr:NUDIX hydrolase [Paenibacillus sp. MBLB1832]WNR45351.1 NUDIX hydrolase [Paenibacillus sp. MBLB1832]
MKSRKHTVSVATIVLNEQNELLLIKGRKRGWEMPGGQVEAGESLQNAAIRETKEESGIDIEIIRFCGIFQNLDRSTVNILFLAKPIGGQPSITKESLETRYFPIDEGLSKVTWKNFRQRIEHCLRPELQPFMVDF